jgi:Ca2+-binding RTX toxin-like protein
MSDMNGGGGPDEIVVTARYVEVTGGDGADVIVASAKANGIFRVDGGAGDDIIDVSAGSGASIDTGSGHDFVDAFHGEGAAPDTITCGAGRDVVWTDAADIVDRNCEHRYYGDPHLREEVAVARAKASALFAHIPNPRAAP